MVLTEVLDNALEITLYSFDLAVNARDVFFVDELVGYVTSYDGSIIKTTDGGLNWCFLDSGTTIPLISIAFADDNTGYAAGACQSTACGEREGLLLRTTDAGATWVSQTLEWPVDLHDIQFRNWCLALAAGTGGVFRTVDGGTGWTIAHEQLPGDSWLLMAVEWLTDTVAIACANAGDLLRSTNGGADWTPIARVDGLCRQLDFPTPSVGFAVSQHSGTSLKTTDGGATWFVLPESPGSLEDMAFVTEEIGVGVGTGRLDEFFRSGAVHLTRDGGATWLTTGGADSFPAFTRVRFPTSTTGYAIGMTGFVRMQFR